MTEEEPTGTIPLKNWTDLDKEVYIFVLLREIDSLTSAPSLLYYT